MEKRKYYISKDELTHFLGNQFVPNKKCMKELNKVLIEGNKWNEGGFHRYGINKRLSDMNIELAIMSEKKSVRGNQMRKNTDLEIGVMNEREIAHALQWTNHRNLLQCKK